MAVSLSACFYLFAAAAHALSTASYIIEIDPKAEQSIDARMTRRLVGLELTEITVPSSVSGDTAGLEPVLYYRIVKGEQGIRVELWERGNFYGARKVSTKGESAQLSARRIALVAAELARRLRDGRLLEARQAQAKKLSELQEKREQQQAFQATAWKIHTAVSARSVGAGDYFLVGPQLGTRLKVAAPLILELGARWLFGRTASTEMTPEHSLEAFELALSPRYLLPLGRKSALSLGFTGAAALVHLYGAERTDSIDGQRQTWTASATAGIGFEQHHSRRLAFRFAGEAGLTLREVPVRFAGQASDERLGGLIVAGSLGIMLR